MTTLAHKFIQAHELSHEDAELHDLLMTEYGPNIRSACEHNNRTFIAFSDDSYLLQEGDSVYTFDDIVHFGLMLLGTQLLDQSDLPADFNPIEALLMSELDLSTAEIRHVAIQFATDARRADPS